MAQLPVGRQAERRLARLGVCDRVGHRASRASTPRVAQPVGQRPLLGGYLQTPVLVEEAQVEMKDALPHDREAEVAGLDHPSMDRADRDLIGVVTVDRSRPRPRLDGMVDQWAQWLVSVKAQAIGIVRLTLIPLGRGEHVDQSVDLPGGCRCAENMVPGGVGEHAIRLQALPAPADEQPTEAPAGARLAFTRRTPFSCRDVLYCRRRESWHYGCLTRAHAIPLMRVAPAWELTSRYAPADSASRPSVTATVRRLVRRTVRPALQRCPWLSPASVSISAWARPRKPSVKSTAATVTTAIWWAAIPPSRIKSSLKNKGEGGNPL